MIKFYNLSNKEIARNDLKYYKEVFHISDQVLRRLMSIATFTSLEKNQQRLFVYHHCKKNELSFVIQ